MKNILLVEDDPILGRGLHVNLETEGHAVHWARGLQEASTAYFQNSFDLILLDLQLPDGRGLDLCYQVRTTNSQIPIIILTAQVDEDSVVTGLEAGANDYVKKPFSNKELFARIKSSLRAPIQQGTQLHYGGVTLNHERRKVYYRSQEFELPRRQFDILSYFFRHAEKVVSRDSLIDALHHDDHIFDRTIDSHISQLRSKLRTERIEDIKISSIYGIGYRLEKK